MVPPCFAAACATALPRCIGRYRQGSGGTPLSSCAFAGDLPRLCHPNGLPAHGPFSLWGLARTPPGHQAYAAKAAHARPLHGGKPLTRFPGWLRSYQRPACHCNNRSASTRDGLAFSGGTGGSPRCRAGSASSGRDGCGRVHAIFYLWEEPWSTPPHPLSASAAMLQKDAVSAFPLRMSS